MKVRPLSLQVYIAVLLPLNFKVYVSKSGSGSGVTNSSDCVNESVQLVDGRSGYDYEGRVELCQDGEWKTICDENWGQQEAQVVCRQLGYPNSSNATHVRRGCTGQGSGGIVVARWLCYGNESRLLDCRREGNQSACDHRRDAGVYCSGQREDDCDLRDLRLVDDPNNGSGRVEICRFGCWGTVCDEGWDRDDAIIACRQLGFETAASAIPTRGAYFGEGRADRPIHLSQVDCTRNRTASQLFGCPNNGTLNISGCQHSQDAGIICHGKGLNKIIMIAEISAGPSMCMDGEVRLVGGESEREGRVEMCYNGVWGAVCANSGWDEIATNIVCNQLEYKNSSFESSWNTPILFTNIICTENHNMLFQCVDKHSVGFYSCNHNSTVRVNCPVPTTTDTITKIAIGIGGVLLVSIIILVLVAILIWIVMTKKRKKSKGTCVPDEKGSADGNSAYNECQGASRAESDDKFEKEFDNPLYLIDDESGPNNSTRNTSSPAQTASLYEEVKEAPMYDSTDNEQSARVTCVNMNSSSSGLAMVSDGAIMNGATPEGVHVYYELQPNPENVGDESCYSVPDSQCQPRPLQIEYPPNDNEYSRLQHK